MIKIRLLRCGAKKNPYYRLVVSDARSPRDGRFIDILGSYAPVLPDSSVDRLKIDFAKLDKWTKVGAQPTDRVKKLVAKLRKEA